MKTITLTRNDGTVLFVNPASIVLYYDSKQANTATPGATLSCVQFAMAMPMQVASVLVQETPAQITALVTA